MRAPKQILLVEDEPTLQRILGSVLADAGHRVESVGTAEQALERLQDVAQPDVDLVLSDKNLPAMSGLDLLHRLRALEQKQGRTVGFVLVTGYPSRDSALTVLAHDGDGYLVKPFRSLTHAVEQIQSVLDSDLARRRSGNPRARQLANILAGLPGEALGLKAAVLVDAPEVAKRIKASLSRASMTIVDVAQLPTAGACAVVSARVEDLVAFGKKHHGASLLLVDAGVSFTDLVALIGTGGGAIVDPGLVLAGAA